LNPQKWFARCFSNRNHITYFHFQFHMKFRKGLYPHDTQTAGLYPTFITSPVDGNLLRPKEFLCRWSKGRTMARVQTCDPARTGNVRLQGWLLNKEWLKEWNMEMSSKKKRIQW
jgi:hypothetical protein